MKYLLFRNMGTENFIQNIIRRIPDLFQADFERQKAGIISSSSMPRGGSDTGARSEIWISSDGASDVSETTSAVSISWYDKKAEKRIFKIYTFF